MSAMAATGNKIRIQCSHRDPALDPQRLGFILEVMGRSPIGAGCTMMRDPTGWGTGFRLTCARCGRAPEFTLATWRRLVDGLDQARVGTLDIAALPF